MLELLAREREVDAQRDETLLRAVVQVALDALRARRGRPRGSARATRAAPPRARRSRRRAASPIPPRAPAPDPRRASRRRPSPPPARSSRSTGTQAPAPAAGGVSSSRRARGSDRLRVAVAQAAARRRPARRDRRPATAPGVGRAASRSSIARCAARGEPVRLQQRDQEPERQQHAGGDDAPRQRARAWPVQHQDPRGEVEDEVRRQEQQRGDGDRHERAPLRPRGPREPRDVHHEHGDRDRQRGVRLGLARDLHDGGRGADLQDVLRTGGGTAGQRPAAGDHRREQRPRNEEGHDAEPSTTISQRVGGPVEPAHREGEEQVERQHEERRLRQHADVERQRRSPTPARTPPRSGRRTRPAAARTGWPVGGATSTGRRPSARPSGSSSTARRPPDAADARSSARATSSRRPSGRSPHRPTGAPGSHDEPRGSSRSALRRLGTGTGLERSSWNGAPLVGSLTILPHSAVAPMRGSPGSDDSPPPPVLDAAAMTRERWMALLFATGSLCFLIGPFPGYVELVGPGADAVTFFAGSLLFTGGRRPAGVALARRPRRGAVGRRGAVRRHLVLQRHDVRGDARLAHEPGLRQARLAPRRVRLDLLPRVGRDRLRRLDPPGLAPACAARRAGGSRP